ncbi:MAG: 3-deoxy-7-phosphoheptulonate synthase [Oscillospiraceae bacterium]|jgi:3-deoxy-7-phosphoheptulonate synthase|nr:3-deoxy-7-phosphoheptulonate synthase [Oscillospiraceae bacterium]
MIIILKNNAAREKVDALAAKLRGEGFTLHYSEGKHTTIIGLIGDTYKLDPEDIAAYDIVEGVRKVSEPYKKANRKFHPEDTRVTVGKATFGEGFFQVIAGPCSVESEEQIVEVAEAVKKSGATLLRGGAFKPRTSPYSFQGLEGEGLRLLLAAKRQTGLPIVTEIMDLSTLGMFDDVDVIQVGARNMQNFSLLKELGKTGKPILLKRGMSSTIEEWLMSAEYIMSGGNERVILCERGIRTFETAVRNTLDIVAVPVLKRLSHLPVIIDPSHATGQPWLVEPISKAAVAIGADGLIIEVHNNPEKALCDGAQSLTPAEFDGIMGKIRHYAAFEGREFGIASGASIGAAL